MRGNRIEVLWGLRSLHECTDDWVTGDEQVICAGWDSSVWFTVEKSVLFI